MDRPDPPSPVATVQIAPGIWIAGDGLRLQYSRSGGPGGQNVNKVSSKAELWVRVMSLTGLTDRALARLRDLAGSRLTKDDTIHLRSETQRSQEANREEVFERLRELVIAARHEPRPRKRTRPSKASKQRRLESKKHRSQTKSQRRGSADGW